MPVATKGLEDVVACESKLSFIDGEKGILEYVGIPIGELASKSTFEEATFLLWNKRLPKKGELEKFTSDLRSRYELPAGMEDRLKALPKDAQADLIWRELFVERTPLSELAEGLAFVRAPQNHTQHSKI
jgi:citrate synthase